MFTSLSGTLKLKTEKQWVCGYGLKKGHRGVLGDNSAWVWYFSTSTEYSYWQLCPGMFSQQIALER
jgi:hypothetical protein